MSEKSESGLPADETQAQDEEISLLELLGVLAKHKAVLLGLPSAAAVVAIIVSLSLAPIYTAQTRILPPQQRESSAVAALSALSGVAGGLAGGAVGQALGIKNPNELYVGILKGQTVADRMIERYRLQELFATETLVATRKALEGVSKFSSGKDGLIMIEVEDRDPKRAAELANGYVEELGRLMQGLAITEAGRRRLFFERQLNAAREQLVQAEVALRQGIQEKGLAAVEAQGRAVVGTVERFRAEVTVKQIQLDAMRSFATEQNPDAVRLRQEIRSVQSELGKLESGSGRQKGEPGSPSGLENLRLLREAKFLETMVELLIKQLEAAKIDEAQDAPIIQVVDKATPPDYKSKPKRAMIILLSILAAGFAAVLYAFASEALHKARADPQSAPRLARLREQLR